MWSRHVKGRYLPGESDYTTWVDVLHDNAQYNDVVQGLVSGHPIMVSNSTTASQHSHAPVAAPEVTASSTVVEERAEHEGPIRFSDYAFGYDDLPEQDEQVEDEDSKLHEAPTTSGGPTDILLDIVEESSQDSSQNSIRIPFDKREMEPESDRSGVG